MRDCIIEHGHRALVVDAGLMGEPGRTVDISNAQVAEAGGLALAVLAVADAAEAARSPVIVGFSGIYLPHPARRERDRLAPTPRWRSPSVVISPFRLVSSSTSLLMPTG